MFNISGGGRTGMSNRVSQEFEVSSQVRGDEITLIVIEYEVTRKEVNRYVFRVIEK